MRAPYQALLSLALGLAAAGAALWVPLPGGTPLEHVLNRFLAIDDLRLVLSVGALVFGLSAIVAVAHSFSNGLRQIAQRARELLDVRRDGMISRSDWEAAIAGTPFEEIAPILLPARRLPFLHAAPGEADETNQFGTTEANMELRRLFWHRIARLQVWTATGILFAVGVLSLIYRRLGLDGDGSLIMLILAPAGILLIAICAALARLSVGRSIKDFFADLTAAPMAVPESVLRLTSDMRVSEADRGYGQFDPTFPTPIVEREPVHDGSQSLDLERLTDPVGDLGDATRAELDAALARILASIERLETQQRAASQDAAALRDAVRGIGNRPPAPPPRSEDDGRIASLQSSFAELMVGMRTTKERTDRELAAFVGEVRDGQQYHQQAIGELAASLNRLEARLVPILRHVAATNRAMALLAERAERLETQLSKFEADFSQERAAAASVVTPLHPVAGDDRAAELAGITSELRQLLSELEDAAESEPLPEARAAP